MSGESPKPINDFYYNQEFIHLNTASLKLQEILSSLTIGDHSRLIILAKKSPLTSALIHAAYINAIPYIPIDIDQPTKRIEQLLKQIQPGVIFIDTTYPELTALFKNEIILWESGNYRLLQVNVYNKSMPTGLTTVLFTSGSTGTPKGVMISKENIEVFTNWILTNFQINQHSRILSIAPLHFDLSMVDLYAVTKGKATLFFPESKMIMNPLYLMEYIFTNTLNTMYATPTWFHLLLSFGKPERYDLSFVKTILIAGEPLQEMLAHKLHKIFPNAKISNLYGPTETNVCTFITLDYSNSLPVRNGIVSIGRACPYAEIKLKSDGHLCIKGKSVMLGYWPSPTDMEEYDSGDIAEYDKENDLYYFISRADRMIKRNGYRIEPAEIEACLLSFKGIKTAAVTSVKKEERIIITAHIAPPCDDLDKLHSHCKTVLPVYMLPDDYKQYETIPCTSSGKTDYNTLTNGK